MALTDENNNGFYMPVAPAYGGSYGNNGGMFGCDWLAWIILILLVGGGGWGMGGFGMGGMMPWMMGMGGMAGFGLDYLYPWLNNSQHISDGFRDQQLNTQIGDLRSDVNRGFGDVQLGISGLGRQICETGNGITQAVNSGFSAAEIAANGRQMANMQQGFGIQQGISDLKYVVAKENCDDRAALAQGLQTQTMQEMSNTNALMSAIRDGIQSIKDELCNDRLDAERRDNANLRSELMFAREQASRLAQSDSIVDRTYARFKDCPVNTVSVYGNQPVWTCAGPSFGNNGCGCNGFNAVA